MAAPVPMTAAVGKKITAGEFNAGVKDPLNFLLSGAPMLHMVQNTAQAAFPSVTWTDIAFTDEVVDLDAQHNTSTNTARVVIGRTPGWYLVTGTVCWATSTTGLYRRARLAFNGTAVNGSFGRSIPGGDGVLSTTTTPLVLVRATAVTDYVTMQGFHDVGGGLATVVQSEARSSMTALFIRSA